MCGRGAANTPNTLPLIEITHTKEYRHMVTHACVIHEFIHNMSSQFSPGNLKEESHFVCFFSLIKGMQMFVSQAVPDNLFSVPSQGKFLNK